MTTLPASPCSSADIAALRSEHYNASVEVLVRHSDDLITLGVRPDQPFPPFEAGQYATLGLGGWEPRFHDSLPPSAEADCQRLIRRPYSITTPLVDEAGRLLRASDPPYLEFLIARAQRAGGTAAPPAALTPRLFALQAGARLYLAPKAHGRYTLRGVRDDEQVVFAATGAGEAPHNAMLAELLHRGHRGRIVSLVCVRRRGDLAYAKAHHRLAMDYPIYRFIGLTTREPENIDPQHPHYVGKQYLQDYLESGRLESDLGLALNPANTQVFLCGNPAMIGGAQKRERANAPETRPGMVELLEQRGFRLDLPSDPGNIHIEKW